MAARHPHRPMLRLRSPITLAVLTASLSACLPTATLEHRPEEAHVCKTVQARGWSGNDNRWELKLADGDRAYFTLSDDGSAREIAGPIEGVYWVRFWAFTAGRTSDSPRPTMVFDPSSAVLRIGGREVHALPRLWTAEMRTGNYAPTSELAVPARLSAGSLPSLDFFLAFPVPPPRARDTWHIDAGTITIEGHDVPLPVAESCFTPAKTWWAPIY